MIIRPPRGFTPVVLEDTYTPVTLRPIGFSENVGPVIPDVPGQAFSDQVGIVADQGNPLVVEVNVTTDGEDLTITLMGTLTGNVDVTFNGVTLANQPATGEFTFSNVPTGLNTITVEGTQVGAPTITSINVVSDEPGIAVVPGLAYNNASGFVAQLGNPLNLPVNVTTNNLDLEVQIVGSSIDFEVDVTFNGQTITDTAHNPHFIFQSVPSGANTIDIEGTVLGGPTINQVIVSTWTPPNLPGVVYNNPNEVLANSGNALTLQVNVTTNGDDLQILLSGSDTAHETTVSINGSSVTAQGDSGDFVFTGIPSGLHTIVVEGTGAGGPTITQIEGVVYVPPIPADYDDNDYSIDYRV